MKKLLALALVLTMALTISVFAVTLDNDTTSTTADVTVVIGGAGDLTKVYSVDVSWDSLEFTYNFTSTDEWDPEEHVYITNGQSSGWVNPSATINVTNHSNASVRVAASFAGNSPSLSRNDVTATISNPAVTLNTAVGTEPEAAPTGSFTVSVAGVPSVVSNFNIGTITISFTDAD